MIELRPRYVDARPTIQCIIDQTIHPMPWVLMDTTTGHLHDKKGQAEVFEALPIYYELVSSMTTELDHAHIWRAVKTFYRYVMLSHRWQTNKPTFQLMENTTIYGLPVPPTNTKLQNFCKLMCSLRFHWAWSDTCCVNQFDKGVQQESLVAMFRWYLWRSIWNTCGWTYQEYVHCFRGCPILHRGLEAIP